MEEKKTPSYWDYFKTPFPKARGFSAYRMPGLVVHIPVIIFFIWLGCWLTLDDPWLYPLFLLYLAMGVYLGRDLAILAHYNILITIAVLVGGMILLNNAPLPRNLGVLPSVAITGAIGVLFAIYAGWYSDFSVEEKRPMEPGRFEFLKRFIDRIDNAAALPADSKDVRLRKTLLIFLCAAGMVIPTWGARHLSSLGLSTASYAALGYALLSLLALILLLATKREAVPSWLQLIGLLATPAIIQWEMGGFAASGAVVVWSLLAPLCALVFLGTRWAVPWFAGFALLVLALAGLDRSGAADTRTLLLFSENILLVSCIAFIALRFFIVERDRAEAALALEKERSEMLLLNILPPAIATRLKEEHMALADGYAEVSILFADIVGFTKMSATMSPERLVEILNKLFSRFDLLCETYGVEKIKTIGDAYMVCAGLPEPRRDHAQAIAGLALAMQDALMEHNREFGSDLKIRIGINSGPVVAGVIGLKKFIYDLWGDAVNVASRMESTGVAGRIQVSVSTWELLRNDFVFEAPRTLDIKGLGNTEAYLLKGRILV
jgi:adenylate cyclase